MILEGNLLEIGKINLNKWGISEAGAGDIISSLVGVPLKVCDDRSHGCDYQPKIKRGAQIGKVVSAQRVKNMIRISAEVSDPGAAQKIRQGKFSSRAWSIFTGYKDFDANNMLIGARPLAVSLVEAPAYPGAGYDIVPDAAAAAYENQLTDLDKYYLKGEQRRQESISPAEGLRAALERLEHKYKGAK
ncbi:MAG: hypothetical protein WA144_12515 [Candidatus Methanoperedens sp.]